LTVSRKGAKLRLYAGSYEIEVDDADANLAITGDQVELKRGTEWIARIVQTDENSRDVTHDVGSAHSSVDQSPVDESYQYIVWEPGNKVRLSHWFANTLQLDDAKLASINHLLSETWTRYIEFERQHTTFVRTEEGHLLATVGYASNTEEGKAFAKKQHQFDEEFWTKLDKIVSGKQRASLHALSTLRGDGKGDDTWTMSLKGTRGRPVAYPSVLGWKADWYPVKVEIWTKGTWFHHLLVSNSRFRHGPGDGQTLPPELVHYWHDSNDGVQISGEFTPDRMTEIDFRGSKTAHAGEPKESATVDEQLQGSWRAVATTNENVFMKSLTFYGDRVGVMTQEGAIEGIVSLPDIDTKGAIDFRWQIPDKNPMPISRGLYEIRDGVLWLLVSAEGKPRPTELTADQPGTTLVMCEREWTRSDLPTLAPSKTLELLRWANNRDGGGVATTFSLFIPGRKLFEANSIHAPMAPAYELNDVPGLGDTTFTVQLFLPNLSPRGMEFLARNSIAMAAWPSEFMAARESRRIVKAYYLPDTAKELKATFVEHTTLTNNQTQTEWLRDLDSEGDVLVVYELVRGRLPNIESQDIPRPNAASVSGDAQPSGSSPTHDENIEAYVRGAGKVVDLVPQEQQQSAGEPIPDTSERAVELRISGHDVPLVRRGDRVRLLFEGWPTAEPVGSFGGKVISIDPAVDGEGKFRVLVQEDGTDSWPDKRYLRPGVRTTGWILTRRRSTVESRSESVSPAVPASDVDKSAFASSDDGSKSKTNSENRAASRVQIYFRQPRLAKLTLDNDSELSLVAPGRLRITAGKVYGLVLSNIMSQPHDPLRNVPQLGERFDLLAGWLEVAAVNNEVESYLKTDDILLDFSDDEIAEVQAGGVMTKVVYLTLAEDGKPRHLKILSQTLFEPGDGDAPIRNARLDGDILAVVRLGESVYFDNGDGAKLRRKRVLGIEEDSPRFEEELRQLHNLRVGRKPTIEDGNAIVDRLLSKYPERKATIHGQAAHLFGQSGIKEFGDEVRRHATESLKSEDDIVERSRMFMYLSNAHEVQGRPSEANYWALQGLLELQPFNLPRIAPELPMIGRFNDLVAQPGDGAKQKLYQRLSAAEKQARDAAKQVRELVRFRDIYVDI
ncbi:MAG: HlyD family secretion protein, partial [Planctomycetales bacterium]|nr:HlyD family secretion protein [Planctomycetales bacterium]